MAQTVERAIAILRFVADRPRSLTDVALEFEVHKSTALRLLQTLVAEGLVRQGRDGGYRLGYGLIALANRAMDDLDLRTAAHARLQALVDQYGQTVHLAELVDEEIRYVDKIEGRGPVAMGSRIGLPVELHTAGVAKAILAWVDPPLRERLSKQITYQRYTDQTIVDPTRFARELDVTRERGWAEDDGEKEAYINCVAVPVFSATGSVCAGISMTALRAATPLSELRDLVVPLRDVAREISTEIGWKEA